MPCTPWNTRIGAATDSQITVQAAIGDTVCTGNDVDYETHNPFAAARNPDQAL